MSKLDELIAEFCPNGVKYFRLKECTEMKRGTSATKKTLVEGDVPVISGGKEPAFYCDSPNRDGETITVAGSGAGAGYVQYWNKPIFVNDAFSIKGNEKLYTRYVYHYLLNMQGEIYATKKGGGVPHVHISSIENFKIPIPPLPVQEEIVRILDNFTELTEELTEELTARKKQYEYYRDALLTFGDDVEWKTLGECVLKTAKIRWGENKEESFQYIDLSSVNRDDNKIYETKLIYSDNAPSRAQQIVVKNDVIFGSTRPMLKRYCLVPEEYDNQICSTGFCVLRANLNLVLPKWVFYNISTSAFYTYIEKNQKGASYPAISDKEVKAYKIPLPPIEEQQRIIDILDRFDKLCNDMSEGLPAEIEARQKQYEYYRDKLLTFKEASV